MSRAMAVFAGLLITSLVSCTLGPDIGSGTLHVHPNSWTFTTSVTANGESPAVIWREIWYTSPCNSYPCLTDNQLYARQWDSASQSWKLLDYFAQLKSGGEIAGFHFDSQGQPYLLLSDKSIWTWTATSWKQLGEPFENGQGCGYSSGLFQQYVAPDGSFAIAPDNHPLIARVNPSQGVSPLSTELWVYRWDGLSWVPIGNKIVGVDDTSLSCIGIKVDASGRPMVAWRRYQSNQDQISVQVSSWSGDSWSSSEALVFPALGIPTLGLAIHFQLDLQDRPTLAFIQSNNGIPTAFVKFWDGKKWVLLGDVGTGEVSSVLLEFDATGRPLLAIGEKFYENHPTVQILRWNGASWGQVGGLADLGPGFSGFDVAVAGDLPVVAYLHTPGPHLHARVFSR